MKQGVSIQKLGPEHQGMIFTLTGRITNISIEKDQVDVKEENS